MGGTGPTRTWRLLNKEDEKIEEVIDSSADSTGACLRGEASIWRLSTNSF